MVVSLGSLAGPAAGGALLGLFNWHVLFWINVPIGIIGLYLSGRVLPDDRRESANRFDYPGAGLYAAGIVALMLAVSHGGQWGLARPPHPVLPGAGRAHPAPVRAQPGPGPRIR